MPDDQAVASAPTADQLDKEQLDQLHAATLKASETCFELKKLCATVLVPTGTLVALLNGRVLDSSVFVAGLVVVVTFWFADSVGYFYQRSLRNAMAKIWARRAARSGNYNHAPSYVSINALKAAFNSSMSYYYFLIGLLAVLFLLYGLGVIASSAVVSP